MFCVLASLPYFTKSIDRKKMDFLLSQTSSKFVKIPICLFSAAKAAKGAEWQSMPSFISWRIHPACSHWVTKTLTCSRGYFVSSLLRHEIPLLLYTRASICNRKAFKFRVTFLKKY